MDTSHEQVIRKTIEMLKSSLSEPVSIPDLARKMGYSASHLRLIFYKATGKGILPLQLEMRMDKAKKLLQETGLSISEIAFETGFKSYKSFHQRFVRMVGCSPGVFRRTQGSTAKPAVPDPKRGKKRTDRFFYESFRGPGFNPMLKPAAGAWAQSHGHILGRNFGLAQLQFLQPLPENFVLQFEACLFRRKGLSSSELGLSLCDSTFRGDQYAFGLGRQDGTVSEMQIQGISILVNYDFALRQEIWHRIKLELEDNIITLSVDGHIVFCHRDPFPPPFTKRSHLCLGVTNGEMGLKEFEVLDKGFLPLVKSVRQGDSLYNGEFYASARDFYMRLLSSKNSTADVMELRYKIGLCFLREGHHLQARTWMEKVIQIPETALWADSALSAMLEMDLLEDRLENFERSFRLAWERPFHRQTLRPIIDRTCLDFRRRGFFEKELFLRNLLFSSDVEEKVSRVTDQWELAEIFMQLRDYTLSEKHFVSLINNPMTPKTARINILFSFCNVLGRLEKFMQWSGILDQLESLSADAPFFSGRLMASRAIFLRAQGKRKQALALLSQLTERRDTVPHWPTFALLLGAQILSCAGEWDQARSWIALAERLEPNFPRLLKGIRSASWYPVELAAGRLESAASLLFEDSLVHKELGLDAEEEVKAGIIFFMAGKTQKAQSIWKRTTDFYPQSRINFFGNFAKALSDGNLEMAHQMPYPAERRSEMFYLLGLFCESTGENSRAQAFYKKSIAEDLLRSWPAEMARKKLN